MNRLLSIKETIYGLNIVNILFIIANHTGALYSIQYIDSPSTFMKVILLYRKLSITMGLIVVIRCIKQKIQHVLY